MKAENWIIIKQSLQDVLALTPFEREIFFRESALSDEVKAEIKSLLAVEENAEKFMSVTAGDLTKGFFDGNGTKENSLVGRTIGIYEIVEELGDGGMGAVYLAERTDGKFEQKVAVKMLKREYNTKKIRRRFEIAGKLLPPARRALPLLSPSPHSLRQTPAFDYHLGAAFDFVRVGIFFGQLS